MIGDQFDHALLQESSSAGQPARGLLESTSRNRGTDQWHPEMEVVFFEYIRQHTSLLAIAEEILTVFQASERLSKRHVSDDIKGRVGEPVNQIDRGSLLCKASHFLGEHINI